MITAVYSITNILISWILNNIFQVTISNINYIVIISHV